MKEMFTEMIKSRYPCSAQEETLARFEPGQDDLEVLALKVYEAVFRTDFSRPGFFLIRLQGVESSSAERRFMVALKESLSSQCKMDPRFQFDLDYFSINRFDQKNSTKPHRDGAPHRSVLLLGYEPTLVKSVLTMADYSQVAYKLGLSPEQFLEEFNPMYEKGREQLASHTTELCDFDNSCYQVMVINNSCESYISGVNNWLGVLHCAEIEDDGVSSRVVNSLTLAPSGAAGDPGDLKTSLDHFLNADALMGSY